MHGSLDETYDRLREFESALLRFDDQLRQNWMELSRLVESFDAEWQDGARRQHDELRDGLSLWLRGFLDQDAELYLELLREKIRILDHYLGHAA